MHSSALEAVGFYSHPVLSVLVAATLLAAGYLFTQFSSNPIKHVPGPWYTALSGLPLRYHSLIGKKVFWIHKLHQQYGDVVRISPDQVAFADIDSYKKVFNTTKSWHKTNWYKESFAMPRSGVFTELDPKLHAARRKLLAQPFSKTGMRATFEDDIRRCADLAVTNIYKEAKTQGVADVLKWYILMATDITCLTMFGESFHQIELGKKSEYTTMLETLLKNFAIVYEFPILNVLRYLPVPAFQKLFSSSDLLIEKGKLAVTNARQHTERKNVFTQMIAKVDAGEDGLIETDVCLEAGNLIAAGSDSSSITLTMLTWNVISRPALWDALHKELDELLPSTENVTDADMEKLPLFNATIDETLRLYGAGNGALPRVTPPEGADLAGIHLPGGTTVVHQSYTTHRKPEYFDRPLEYDPSRFLGPQSADMKAAFAPFGGGSRVCLGINMAHMVLRHGFINVLLKGKTLGRLKIADSVTDENMEPDDFFLLAPSAHKMEVTPA